MKILFILLSFFSTLLFADTIQVHPSKITLESILEARYTASTDLNFSSAFQSRGPTTCTWSVCMDNAERKRRNCLNRSNSSSCGPAYDEDRAYCDRYCK